MKKKIAIIGASYLQLPLVLKAKELNIEIHCFAWEEGAVCKEFCDYFYSISVTEKELILEKCREIGIDGITTIATDLPIPTISYVAEKLNLIANNFEVAKNSTDKALMRKCFLKNSVSSPKYIQIRKKDFNPTENFEFPLIVKPTDRSGSRGVTKVVHEADLHSAIEAALDVSIVKEVLIEEFIEGQEVSVESISWKGKHYVLAITDKITTGPPNFVELEHHQPSAFDGKTKSNIEKLTINALNSLGITYGASHTEIKIDKEGNLFVIEVGARMGGDFIGSHLVKLSTGYDYLEGILNVSLNHFSPPISQHKRYAGVYFLSKETEYILPYFELDNEFEVEKKLLNNSLITITNSNDRSGYLIYQSNKKVLL